MSKPSGETVEAALALFMQRYGLDRGGYSTPDFPVKLGPITLTFPNPGRLEPHDMHHLAIDAAPNFWGEVQVSALELRSGVPSFLIGFLCVGSLALGMLLGPRRTLRWWRQYRGTRNLYHEPIAPLRQLPLVELHKRMNLSAAKSRPNANI